MPMLKTPHIDHRYQGELEAIRTALLRMGNRAEGMIRDAARAMQVRDLALARSVVSVDAELDKLEVETDALCVNLMARRAPVGADLRLVTCALKIVTDLERIGDLAVNVAKRTLDISNGPGLEVPPEVRQLADQVLAELQAALEALRDQDANRARRLRETDRSVDASHRRAFDRLIRVAKDHPEQFERALAMTNVCRNLERVGDHAVNIAEMVVYQVEGTVVRHATEL